MPFRLKVRHSAIPGRETMIKGEFATAAEAIKQAKEISSNLFGREIVVYLEYASVAAPVPEPTVTFAPAICRHSTECLCAQCLKR